MRKQQHQLNLPPTLVQTPDRGRTNIGPAHEHPDGQAVDHVETNGLSLLVAAVKDSRCSEKEVALALGCPDQAYWSKVKSTEKPAPRINKLTDAPVPVQRAYVKRWGRQLGMRVSDEDAAKQKAAELLVKAAEYIAEVG